MPQGLADDVRSGLLFRGCKANPANRATTLSRDTTVVRVHLLPLLGSMRLDQLRPSDMKATVDAMAKRGLAPRTIRTNSCVLRAILAWAVQDALIARSPFRGIRLPEVDKTPKPMASADDIARLVEAVPTDYRVAVLLGAMGLREAEVFGLRVESVDFLRRTVTVQATINEVDGLLQAANGGPVRAANFPGVRPGRTAGVPLEVIQRRLGHASIRTTADVYGSLPESVDRAVADQLDQLFRPDGRAATRQGGTRPEGHNRREHLARACLSRAAHEGWRHTARLD